jgi:hypothetical protein
MIVESLSHQLKGQRVFLAGGFFDFSTFVLEPNFDLGFVEAQLGAELLPSFFGEVTVFVEFVLGV